MSSREERRIARLARILGREHEGVTLGIGDDAAVLPPSDGSQVLSVDVQVEGVHFRKPWLSMTDLGHRAFHAAASDLAAMGAAPRAALTSFILPDDVSDADLDDLAAGIASAAGDIEAPVVGGNLARGGELSITTTVIGEVGETRMDRRGAKAGEGVYVTGTVGGAALGVAALEAGRGDDPRFGAFVDAYRRPVAQIVIGRRIVGLASAAADVSDGLVTDLRHVCEASGVGAVLRPDLVPTLPDFVEAAGALDADPLSLALAGGEDFQLVFTAPIATTMNELATLVGEVTDEAGVQCVDADGELVAGEYDGFDHF